MPSIPPRPPRRVPKPDVQFAVVEELTDYFLGWVKPPEDEDNDWGAESDVAMVENVQMWVRNQIQISGVDVEIEEVEVTGDDWSFTLSFEGREISTVAFPTTRDAVLAALDGFCGRILGA